MSTIGDTVSTIDDMMSAIVDTLATSPSSNPERVEKRQMRIQDAGQIGRHIASRRSRLGWSQAELADRVGTSRQWISGIENGKGSVRLDLTLKALEVLGVELHLVDESAGDGASETEDEEEEEGEEDPARIEPAGPGPPSPVPPGQAASYNLEILAYEASPLGPLCLRRRSLLSAPGTVVTEVTLNHEFLMSSLNTASERALADVGLEMHSGRDLRVLVGGLGLGYTAHAALASDRVAEVEVVELLPQVMEWLECGLVPLSEQLCGDRRFRTVAGDVYARLASEPDETFDLILIDVDHAPDDQLNRANDFFYTTDGLERARRHLSPGGLLGVWSYAQSSPFARALDEAFAEVRVEPVTFYNELVEEESTDWLFFAR